MFTVCLFRFLWRKSRSLLVLCSFWALSSVAAFAADDPLTLAEAQRIAVHTSERLLARRYSLSAATELKPAADQLADPVLRLGVDNVPATGADRFSVDRDFMTMTRVGLMQEFTRGEKRRLRAQRADLSVSMAQAEQEMSQVEVERATALAWFDAYYAQQRHELINALLETARTNVAAADSAFAQGRRNAVEALSERGVLVDLQDKALETATKERTARITLARWIAEQADRPLSKRPNIEELPLHAHRDIAELEAQLREHPDIVLLDRQLELARTDAALARAERQSDWSVELSYGRRGQPYDDMVSLGVSIPLQLNRSNRQNRELASRLAMASAAKAQRDDLYREHVAEVRTMLDEWNTTRERLHRYRADMLPLAADRLTLAEANYRGGKIALEEVIAARRNQIEVNLQLLALESELAKRWAELNFLATTGGASAGEKQ